MLKLIISAILLKGYYGLVVEHNDIGVIEIVDTNEPDPTVNQQQQEQEDLLRRRLMPGGLTNQDKLSILNAHNRYRTLTAQGLTNGQPGSSNMNELIWDAGLAQVAQDYSAQCIWAHNSHRSSDLLKYSDLTSFDYTNQAVGENLFITSGAESIDVVLKGIQYWYAEYTYFTYGTLTPTDSTCESGQQCGHYTQLVWGNTRYVGCGYTRCPSASGAPISNAILLVCNYYFAGNIIGYSPYDTGSPATDCGSDRTPNNNLCSGCPNPAWDTHCCEYCSTTGCNEAESSNLLHSVGSCTNGLGVELSGSGSSGSSGSSGPPPTPRPTNQTPRPTNYPTPSPTTRSPTTHSPTPPPRTSSPTTASPTAPPRTPSPTHSSSNGLSSNVHTVSKGCCKAVNTRYTNFCASIQVSNTCGLYPDLCSWSSSC